MHLKVNMYMYMYMSTFQKKTPMTGTLKRNESTISSVPKKVAIFILNKGLSSGTVGSCKTG